MFMTQAPEKPRENPQLERPWLSVIMPTYNGEKYLSQAIQSVLDSAQNDIEIIAIDDGSTDSTLTILSEFANNSPVTIIRKPHCGNWVSATNQGLRLARGEYISFLHQDDFWLPARAVTMKALTDRFPVAVVALHPVMFVDQKSKRLGTWHCPFGKFLSNSSQLISGAEVFRKLIVQNFIAICAPLVKREVALSLAELDETLWYTADWKFWLELTKAGPWAYSNKVLAAFRIHSESQTLRGAPDAPLHEAHLSQLSQVLNQFLPELPANDANRKPALFSAAFNAYLAQLLTAKSRPTKALFMQGLNLGPFGIWRYIKYSRIIERVKSRLHANL